MGKYGKYKALLVDPLPDFKDKLTFTQRQVEAAELWKSNNGARLLLKLPQYFGPVDWSYLAPLVNIATFWKPEAPLVGTPLASFGGSAQHLSRLLRRTMCKLLHDLMGQKILRKIKQLN